MQVVHKVAVLASAVAAFAGHTSQGQVTEAKKYAYRLVDLGTEFQTPVAINQKGVIAGSGSFDAQDQGFSWYQGKRKRIGVPPDQVFAINNLGEMAGSYNNSSQQTYPAAFSKLGRQTDIVTPNGQEGSAYAINDSGQIVGELFGTPQVAFIYQGGTVTLLNAPVAKGASSAVGINKSGLIVGFASFPAASGSSVEAAAIYANGAWTDIDTLSSGTSFFSEAEAVNDLGWIVGVWEPATGNDDFFLYKDGVMTALNFPEFANSIAINNRGQIVGGSLLEEGEPGPYGYRYHNGQWQNLNDLIDPKSGLTVVGAFGIDDNGDVVGSAVPSGNQSGLNHGVLLVPQ
jgi:probable HAF family extracellular repeat protein